MNGQAGFCVSVFKNGEITKEEYTKVWIALVNQLIKFGKLNSAEEEK